VITEVLTPVTRRVSASGMQSRVICLTGTNVSKKTASICEVEEREVGRIPCRS